MTIDSPALRGLIRPADRLETAHSPRIASLRSSHLHSALSGLCACLASSKKFCVRCCFARLDSCHMPSSMNQTIMKHFSFLFVPTINAQLCVLVCFIIAVLFSAAFRRSFEKVHKVVPTLGRRSGIGECLFAKAIKSTKSHLSKAWVTSSRGFAIMIDGWIGSNALKSPKSLENLVCAQTSSEYGNWMKWKMFWKSHLDEWNEIANEFTVSDMCWQWSRQAANGGAEENFFLSESFNLIAGSAYQGDDKKNNSVP